MRGDGRGAYSVVSTPSPGDAQSGEHGDKEVHVSQAPRLRDVAERAGVSVSLVSAFINRPDQVSKKTSLRIEEAIRELRFVPNDAARQLRRGSSRILAFVALDAGDPFFTSVARGAQARASERRMGLVLADTHGNVDTEREDVAKSEEGRGGEE